MLVSDLKTESDLIRSLTTAYLIIKFTFPMDSQTEIQTKSKVRYAALCNSY